MQGAELINRIVRVTIVVLSSGVMVIGIALIVGVASLRSVPGEWRTVVGIVVFLYGLYRLVRAVFRRERE